MSNPKKIYLGKNVRVDYNDWAEMKAENTKLQAALDVAKTRLEGMVLSFKVHGNNLNVQFHIDWFEQALSEIEELLK